MTKLLLIAVTFIAFNFAIAEEKATKEEVTSKVNACAKMLDKDGLEKTCTAMADKAKGYIWKDTYVFIIGIDGKIVCHPVTPALVGKDWNSLQDKNGKFFIQDMGKMAKEKATGWVDYMWPKPGAKEPSKKNSYVHINAKKDMYCGGGTYE